MKREEINIRDPFVLVYDGKYYLYGTRGATCWGEADGFDCYVGTDLEEFEGPFVPYSDGSITPKEWASLDGTLYVDTDGTPYMVFCHEWEDTDGEGTVCAVELTKDLKAPVGEPRLLFRATE